MSCPTTSTEVTETNSDVKDAVHAKLTELERRVDASNVDRRMPEEVTVDMYCSEMRRLAKLNHMRAKIVNS